MDINVDSPFMLYAKASIKYDGRARSILKCGNYLIIHKEDGSLLIHAANGIPPRNYQGSKSKIKIIDDKIISENKKETITIVVKEIEHYVELNNWSFEKVEITKTERELTLKLASNIEKYIDESFEMVFVEHAIDVGIIDVLAIDSNNVHHIIEVKRGKANISACSQLKRYVECYCDFGKKVRGYVASPSASKSVYDYCYKNNYGIIKIDF